MLELLSCIEIWFNEEIKFFKCLVIFWLRVCEIRLFIFCIIVFLFCDFLCLFIIL